MHELFQTRVSKRQDVPWDVLGQSGTGCHVVPLSWDKKVSLFRCPFALGQKNSVTELMGKTEDDFVPQDVPGWDGTASNNPGPVLWQDFELVPLSLCQENPIPLETLSQTDSNRQIDKKYRLLN